MFNRNFYCFRSLTSKGYFSNNLAKTGSSVHSICGDAEFQLFITGNKRNSFLTIKKQLLGMCENGVEQFHRKKVLKKDIAAANTGFPGYDQYIFLSGFTAFFISAECSLLNFFFFFNVNSGVLFVPGSFFFVSPLVSRINLTVSSTYSHSSFLTGEVPLFHGPRKLFEPLERL